MYDEMDPEELDALRKRALDKLKADQLTSDESPNGTLGMRLATGAMDALSRANNNSLGIAETVTGKKLAAPNGPVNMQDRYMAEMRNRATLNRQKALDDMNGVDSITKLIDAKNARELASTQRGQDLQVKGYSVGGDGKVAMIPGGVADIDAKDKLSQANQRNAMAKYYEAGRGSGGKGGVNTDKLAKALKDDLDPNKSRGGNLAKSQAMVNSADRVDALFQQFPDYNIPKGQTVELSSAIAGLINGGSAQSQHQIDSLTPQSLRGDAQGLASWLTNDPTGMEQQNFMKMMHETALRERSVAQDQVKSAQTQRLSAHRSLQKADPETYNAILQSYDIDPSEIVDGKFARKGKAAPGANPQTQGADYHGMSDAELTALYNKRVGGK